MNIEEFDISGSLKKIKQGDLADVRIKGVFMFIPFDFTIDFDFSAIEKGINALWGVLHSHAKNHKHLPAAVEKKLAVQPVSHYVTQVAADHAQYSADNLAQRWNMGPEKEGIPVWYPDRFPEA